MRYISARSRGGSASGSGTVKSGALHGIDCSADSGAGSLGYADGVSRYGGSEKPGCLNMIRHDSGRVMRRPGFRLCGKPGGLESANAAFTFTHSNGAERYFFISGDTMTYSLDGNYSMNGTPNVTVTLPTQFNLCIAAQTDDCLFLMNGSYLVIYRVADGKMYYIGSEGQTNKTSPDSGMPIYLPRLFIGCTPSGGDSAYEAVNLLNPFVSEQFVSDGSSTQYSVHLDIKPGSQVKAQIKNESGQWDDIQVQSFSGKTVTFASSLQAPAVSGEDNVRITYEYTGFADGAKRIAGCMCMTTFGVGGYRDRVFLAANGNCPQTVVYSEMDKPLYFPDLNYIKPGDMSTRTVALACDGTRLAVICNDGVYMVSGSTSLTGKELSFDPSALFYISSILRTFEPFPVVSPKLLDNETVYLTSNGVSAITASGVLDERCCQIRSARVNRYMMTGSSELFDMICWGDYLVISDCDGRLYLLDGKNYSKSAEQPFSSRQYDAYVWDGIPAQMMWLQNGRLYFCDGSYVYRFEEGLLYDVTASDPHRAISSYWETPDIFCSGFHLNKFFDRLGLHLADTYDSSGKYLNTDVRILAKFDNDGWRVVRDYGGQLSVFRYDSLGYGSFTYSDRARSGGVYSRLLHKKGRSVRLRFENENADQPFEIQGFLLEYMIM